MTQQISKKHHNSLFFGKLKVLPLQQLASSVLFPTTTRQLDDLRHFLRHAQSYICSVARPNPVIFCTESVRISQADRLETDSGKKFEISRKLGHQSNLTRWWKNYKVYCVTKRRRDNVTIRLSDDATMRRRDDKSIQT